MFRWSIAVNNSGVARLKKYIALDRSKANDFYALVGGRATDPISGKDLREILSGIAAKPGGVTVAGEILYMRFHSDRDKQLPSAPELLEAGRDLLQSIVFVKDNRGTQAAALILSPSAPARLRLFASHLCNEPQCLRA